MQDFLEVFFMLLLYKVTVNILFFLFSEKGLFKRKRINEPWHEMSSNVVCATRKASDQPAHMCSLIWAFAWRLNTLWLHHLEFLSFKGGFTGSTESTLGKMPHMSWLKLQTVNIEVGMTRLTTDPRDPEGWTLTVTWQYGVARTLKKMRTSKGDYWIKQWFSSIAPFSKWVPLLKEIICSQRIWKNTFTTLGDLLWMLLFSLRTCVTA